MLWMSCRVFLAPVGWFLMAGTPSKATIASKTQLQGNSVVWIMALALFPWKSKWAWLSHPTASHGEKALKLLGNSHFLSLLPKLLQHAEVGPPRRGQVQASRSEDIQNLGVSSQKQQKGFRRILSEHQECLLQPCSSLFVLTPLNVLDYHLCEVRNDICLVPRVQHSAQKLINYLLILHKNGQKSALLIWSKSQAFCHK